jgi:hypothetical protein
VSIVHASPGDGERAKVSPGTFQAMVMSLPFVEPFGVKGDVGGDGRSVSNHVFTDDGPFTTSQTERHACQRRDSRSEIRSNAEPRQGAKSTSALSQNRTIRAQLTNLGVTISPRSATSRRRKW